MKRGYSIDKFGGVTYIAEEDATSVRVFAFGPKGEYNFNQAHRQNYTIEDARDIVKWLNERAAGYPINVYALDP